MAEQVGWGLAVPHNCGAPPDDDPKSTALVFNLATNVETFTNLRDRLTQGNINNIQSVFIDNNTAAQIILYCRVNSYRIVAKPYTQGWYPLLLPDNAGFSVTASAAVAITLLLANVQISSGPYPTQ